MVEKLLFHVCCAPCFIAPYEHLKEEFHIYAFWFNHNIHPYTEYQKRLGTLRKFVAEKSVDYIEKDEYLLENFLQQSVYRESKRCYSCYYERLKYTAIVAKKGHFNLFSTTLLYSKFQNHEMIKQIGYSLAAKYNLIFYDQDLRKFWKEGIEMSKQAGMYRQQYCGCIFSERDRYLGKGKNE